MEYKSRTGVKVVAAMMDVAASGGYYVALAADAIYAHPTSLTGSVGVIFMRPKLTGLMDKIGVGVEVNKSGRYKDMGSPFRTATQEEERLLQELTEEMAARFHEKVAERRQLGAAQMATVKTARIFTASDAKAQGLIDGIGYLSDALQHAKSAAELGEDARVVIYRRTMFPDDNIYNPLSTGVSGQTPVLLDTGIHEWLPEMAPGFYYLWPAAVNLD
jgi:protease-4